MDGISKWRTYDRKFSCGSIWALMINKYGHLQNTVTQLLCKILHEESEKPTVQNKSRPQLIGENKKNNKK